MQEFIINKNDSGQRLDKYLTKSFPLLPKSLMYKFIRTKKIKVNRKRALPEQILIQGDVVATFIPYEFTSDTADADSFKKITPKIDVVFENDDFIICDKPVGMSSIPDDHETLDTVINNIQAYLYQKGEYDPDREMSFAPALCNRLDRNTGGLIIAAKNADSLREINSLIKKREIKKKYLCVVHGVPPKKEDVLRSYMVKDSASNLVKVYDSDPGLPDSRTMITGYRLLASADGLSLLEVELFTGRTHQIRAHLSHIGNPLLGDGKYGVNGADRKLGYKYQALYSYSLEMKGQVYSIPPQNVWFVKELFPDYFIK